MSEWDQAVIEVARQVRDARVKAEASRQRHIDLQEQCRAAGTETDADNAEVRRLSDRLWSLMQT